MISIDQYRAVIGLFHCHVGKKRFKSDYFFFTFIFPNFLFYNWVLPKIIMLAGDIEANPGPETNKVPEKYHIGHVNICSILAPVKLPQGPNLKKIDLIKSHVLAHKYSIFGISETWLDTSDDNSLLCIPGYQNPIRRDITGHQGSVMVYILNEIPARHRPDLDPTDSQIICTELQLHGVKVLISNVYRPPHKDMVDFCLDMESIIDKSAECQKHIFIGDTNGRNSDFWEFDHSTLEGRALKSWIDTSGFDQLINEPTRIVNESKSCIDHVFTNDQSLFSEVGVRPNIASDHCPIFAMLNYKIYKPRAYKRWVWDYKNGDFEKFKLMLLDAPWYLCYNSSDVNVTVENWMKMFTTIAEACVPHYEATIRPGDKGFMNSEIRLLMRQRDRLFNQSKLSNDPDLKKKYKEKRNQVLTSIRISKINQEKKVNDAITNPDTASKKWWNLYKNVISGGEVKSVGSLLDGNKIVTDDVDKATLLNNFFVSQTKLNENQSNTLGNPPPCATSIDQKIVMPVDVFEVLTQLDITKATGPDGIGNMLLKEAAVPIAEPLSQLFNYSLSIGTFPDVWKTAHVIAIHKKGDSQYCNNYRPISLLCCISKVFEKIIFNHIYTYLKENNLINIRQSGFTEGDCTINQLIAICNLIAKNLDSSDEVLAVFLDLTKAFDKVWHTGLKYKIERCGITGNLLKWLSSYLSQRTQRVVINGKHSELQEIQAGVPQGSVLGPLLFLIYINDICENLSCETFLFADDTSIFKPVNHNITQAAKAVNSDLQLITNWSRKWLVTLNPQKMLFSGKLPPSVVPLLRICNNIVSQVHEHKHLVLTFTPNISWTKHISNIIVKGNRRLGVLKKR